MEVDYIIEENFKHPDFYRDSLDGLWVANPLCGDKIIFSREEDKLVYNHHGCVLSNVSAAAFCQLFILNKIDEFRTHEVFQLLEKFPTREKCLNLPIEGYKSFLASSSA